MQYFLLRLNPPRPTFDVDMNETEAKVMQEHIAYWTELANRRTAIVFGPVKDPAGAWGVAVIEVDGRTAADAITSQDPTIKSGLGFSYDVLAMPLVILRK